MSRLTFVIALTLASPAFAADSSGVAVLDIQGTGISPELLPTLTEILTVEIAEFGMYKVIAGRDIQSMLGFERQKDVLGCTDAACLAEIGGALGVDRIVASHVGMVGSTYVVNIKLINIRQADTEGRVYETVRGEVDALISIVKTAAQRLLGPGSKAAIARGFTGKAPAPRPTATPAPQTTVQTPPAAQPAPRSQVAVTEPPASTSTTAPRKGGIGVMPWVFWGAGAVALAGGAAFGIKAKNEQGKANDMNQPGSQVAAESAPSSAKVANLLFGVGGLAVAGGVLWAVLGSGSSSDSGTALAPVMGSGGIGIAAVGRF